MSDKNNGAFDGRRTQPARRARPTALHDAAAEGLGDLTGATTWTTTDETLSTTAAEQLRRQLHAAATGGESAAAAAVAADEDGPTAPPSPLAPGASWADDDDDEEDDTRPAPEGDEAAPRAARDDDDEEAGDDEDDDDDEAGDADDTTPTPVGHDDGSPGDSARLAALPLRPPTPPRPRDPRGRPDAHDDDDDTHSLWADEDDDDDEEAATGPVARRSPPQPRAVKRGRRDDARDEAARPARATRRRGPLPRPGTSSGTDVRLRRDVETRAQLRRDRQDAAATARLDDRDRYVARVGRHAERYLPADATRATREQLRREATAPPLTAGAGASQERGPLHPILARLAARHGSREEAAAGRRLPAATHHHRPLSEAEAVVVAATRGWVHLVDLAREEDYRDGWNAESDDRFWDRLDDRRDWFDAPRPGDELDVDAFVAAPLPPLSWTAYDLAADAQEDWEHERRQGVFEGYRGAQTGALFPAYDFTSEQLAALERMGVLRNGQVNEGLLYAGPATRHGGGHRGRPTTSRQQPRQPDSRFSGPPPPRTPTPAAQTPRLAEGPALTQHIRRIMRQERDHQERQARQERRRREEEMAELRRGAAAQAQAMDALREAIGALTLQLGAVQAGTPPGRTAPFGRAGAVVLPEGHDPTLLGAGLSSLEHTASPGEAPRAPRRLPDRSALLPEPRAPTRNRHYSAAHEGLESELQRRGLPSGCALLPEESHAGAERHLTKEKLRFDPDKDADPIEWVLSALDIAEQCGWNERQGAAWARRQLQGSARTWQQTLPRTITGRFTPLVRALIGEFRSTDYRDRLKAELTDRAQRSTELAAAYARDLRTLWRKLHGTTSVISDEEALDRFTRGLRPSLRKAVAQHGARTMDEAVQVATRYEAATRQERKIAAVSEPTPRYTSRPPPRGQGRPRPRGSRPGDEKGLCRNCQQPDHWYTDCPKPLSPELQATKARREKYQALRRAARAERGPRQGVAAMEARPDTSDSEESDRPSTHSDLDGHSVFAITDSTEEDALIAAGLPPGSGLVLKPPTLLAARDPAILAVGRRMRLQVPVKSQGRTLSPHALVDTGASVSAVADSLAARWADHYTPGDGGRLVGAGGRPLPAQGHLHLPITIGDASTDARFVVIRGLQPDCILGMDVLSQLDAVVDTKRQTLQLGTHSPVGAIATMTAATQAPPPSGTPGMEDHPTRQKGGEEERKEAPGTSAATTDKEERGESPTDGFEEAHEAAKAQREEDTHIEKGQLQEQLPRALDESLTPRQRSQVTALFHEFPGVVGVGGEVIGCTSAVEHHIPTDGHRPIYQRGHRLSPADRKVIKEEVARMLANGAIKKSESPWASRVVIVAKKDGTRRFCVDYRRLNDATKKDRYPLPRIDDTLAALGHSCFYTTLDLASGYWQIRVAAADTPKTAFITEDGLYEWNVMPFGLCNAPATFQRLMNVVMSGIKGHYVLVYLDDVIIFSKTWDDHLSHLKEVLARLDRYHLKLKLKKCRFGATRVPYLGHIVDQHGVAVDPAKVEAVAKAPRPTNLTELRRFLGLAGYYRRFIPAYAQVTGALTRLLKKDTPYTWTKPQQQAFDRIKHRLTSAPLLVYPDLGQPFTLFTDASDEGLGAVLAQHRPAAKGKDREHVVEYASRGLTPAEKNYTTTEKECLAVVWAVRKFRHYLDGRRFTVVTDHAALKWLWKGDGASLRIRRWVALLQALDFTIVHRAGKVHYNADALSRMVVSMPANPTSSGEILAISELHEAVAEAQQRHSGIRRMKAFVTTGRAPGLPADLLRRLEKASTNYVVHNGLLHFQDGTGKPPRLVVPRELRRRFLELLHDNPMAGHGGLKKTLARVEKRLYWKGWRQDVDDYVAACPTCARHRRGKGGSAPLKPLVPRYPFETVALDVTGPLTESARGNRYLLVFSEYFTRYADAWPLKETSAETIARVFVDQVVARYGLPTRLLTDNGSNFVARFMATVCRLLKVKRVFTTTYHPQTDGVVERFNGTLKAMLRKYIADDQKDWDDHVRLLLLAYNTSKHAALGETPFYLMFGREPRLAVEAMLDTDDGKGESTTVTAYRELLTRRLTQARRLAREAREAAARRTEAGQGGS
ncbi:MAG: DDE-type integrase/transposase/recombinase, partial [bacterium]|nr:DDE-type integrase/transposase/recombinase [bacterium]